MTSHPPSWTEQPGPSEPHRLQRRRALPDHQQDRPLPSACLAHLGLRKALRFIHENYSDHLRLADVAAEACLTECYFSTLFSRSTGVTFQRYVIALRVERAKQIIRAYPWRSISRVAHESGFGTLRNLEIHFRRHTGVTPSQYRAGRSA